MSFGIFLVIASFVLLVLGVWVGYRASPNKEARELLAKTTAEALAKKAKEEAEGREKNRLANQRAEIYEAINRALSDPNRELLDARYGSITRGKSRWQSLLELAEGLRDRRQDLGLAVEFGQRLDALAKSNRELKGQVAELQKALAPYA